MGVSLLLIIAVALIAALMAVFLKSSRLPAAALLVTLSAGAVILLQLLPTLRQLLDSFSQLGQLAGADPAYLALLLKIIGLAYVAEFGAQLCRDAGQGAAALKIEFAAKLAIMLLALPIAAAIITAVLSLL